MEDEKIALVRLVLVLTLVTTILFAVRLSATAAAPPLSLAVIPPVDLNKSGIPDLGWLSIGIQESMTVDLWKVPVLRTVALPEYIRTANDLPQVVSRFNEVRTLDLGRKLGLSQVWRGEFRLSDKDVVYISYTALETDSGKQLFSESVAGNLADVPQLTGQLVLAMLQKAKIAVTDEIGTRMRTIKTTSKNAFKFNAMAFEKFNDTSRGRQARQYQIYDCIDYLKQAVKADPDYADAWINLGWAYQAGNSGKFAMESFTKAITLKPYLLDAWMGIGYEERASNNASKAIAAFTRAIELNPSLEWPRRELIAITGTVTATDDQQLLKLAEDPVLEVRLAALNKLAGIKQVDSLPILERAMERPEQAVEVLTLIISVKPLAALPYLIEALQKSSAADGSRLAGLPESTLKNVMRKFVQFKLRQGIPELITTLNNSNPALRESAMAALADMEATEAVPYLHQSLAKEHVPTVRGAALVALIVLGDQRARQGLQAMLNDQSDLETTNYATFLLKKRKIKF